MMCEGIMLFLLLVVVFTSIGKRWYLFLIIGWGVYIVLILPYAYNLLTIISYIGVPIIPVAISSGLIYKQYGSPGRQLVILCSNYYCNYVHDPELW